MMSYRQIQEMSAAEGRRAARLKRHPYIVTQFDLDKWRYLLETGRLPQLPFPNIGNWRPRGWKLVDTELVDKSGFGAEAEPATTIRAFIGRSLKPDFGYAIIEEGQFQVVIGRFATAETAKREKLGLAGGE